MHLSRMRAILFTVAAFVLVPAGVSAQQIRARVIDAESRTPVVGASVSVLDSAQSVYATAHTGADGFFSIERPPQGAYTLVVEHAGYGAVRQPLTIGAGEVTIPAILLRSSTILLDSIEARTQPRPQVDGPVQEFVLAGARMAKLERANAHAESVYRMLSPGLRIRGGGGALCVHSSRGPTSMRNVGSGAPGGAADICDPVLIVLNGQLLGNGGTVLRDLKVRAYESIEYLPPVQAAFRYGLRASAGALVLWGRGFGPHQSPTRNTDPPPPDG